ncbi:hypothetical protein GYMLUDRAFT_58478 [Collybiopsis luxurians FD-317 M1]|uniref:Uncharacterized protein n=1 Tax=Collybiopsis luxurians FD-317 M1 TaxID=944289 RepID=A0A0D0BEW7_9AGAR|nr:hypothetical protein GYMLUDRAFT_58478 [Collybiopsis luxurians FD-317 M1]
MLQAYSIQNEMDMRAMDKVINNTSVNSFSPCQSCSIKGIRDPNASGGGYYCPLAHISFDEDKNQLYKASGQPVVQEWPVNDLPYHTHESFIKTTDQIAQATTKHEQKIIRFQTPSVSRRKRMYMF